MTANTPTLLDCTLRDGGNQNNWQFTQHQANRIVSALDEAFVDVIEVGYRGGSGSRRDPDAGITSQCDASYLRALPRPKHSKLAVMVVPSVCSLAELDDLAAHNISLLRIAAYPWDMSRADPFIARAQQLGMSATVNLMAASYVTRETIADYANRLANTPDAFYIADSFGALGPTDVAERIHALRARTGLPIGGHFHNNLGLASANTLAALEAGATWIDASLCGMARGAGNLPTEQAVGLLQSRPEYSTRARLEDVGTVADFVLDEVLTSPMRIGPDEIASGVNNHHYYFQPIIRERSAEFRLDPLAVGRAVGLSRPRSVSEDLVLEICKDLSVKRFAETGERA